jgi:dTDP-4-dehydrorhamnose 3,5-epimerase
MLFSELSIPGAYTIELSCIEDHRGFFARTFCREEFSKRGLNPYFEQGCISYNRKKGTLRGMHYQEAPHAEVKIIRCVKGSLYDVLLDLRPSSPTFKKWVGVELNEAQYCLLYLPEGIAHGFQTLQDDTEISYQISTAYAPEAARGVRWDDPAFGIQWPLKVEVISEKDQNYPLFV